MKGKVFLVGAGPGDPELLTLKAARVLRTADVVLHDDLVSVEVLQLVPPEVRQHNVGKRCGTKKLSQSEINFLMVSLAGAGLKVVRLKAGDPLLFGRAAEEIAALRAAEIDFEIIPGVTAALGAGAAAQIPLTDRAAAHSVVFLAGQHATDRDPTNWQALVSLGATVVVYMPGRRYAEIARKLRTAGLAADTPCALISQATTAREQVHVTDLENLHDSPNLPAPTLLVIGEVAHRARRDAVRPPNWNSIVPAQEFNSISVTGQEQGS